MSFAPIPIGRRFPVQNMLRKSRQRADGFRIRSLILRRVVLSAILGVILIGTRAKAVEEPSFKTVLREGTFEVRDYPALVVAEVTVSGDNSDRVSARQVGGTLRVCKTFQVNKNSSMLGCRGFTVGSRARLRHPQGSC